jgi:hypothetical protein
MLGDLVDVALAVEGELEQHGKIDAGHHPHTGHRSELVHCGEET